MYHEHEFVFRFDLLVKILGCFLAILLPFVLAQGMGIREINVKSIFEAFNEIGTWYIKTIVPIAFLISLFSLCNYCGLRAPNPPECFGGCGNGPTFCYAAVITEQQMRTIVQNQVLDMLSAIAFSLWFVPTGWVMLTAPFCRKNTPITCEELTAKSGRD